MSLLRTERRCIVVHYSPIAETVKGEPLEIYPYLGNSRFAEVVDRHGASLVVHAHHGSADGKGAYSVYDVALSILQRLDPPMPYRIFNVSDFAEAPDDDTGIEVFRHPLTPAIWHL